MNKDDFITTPAGNLNWYEFPKDEETQKLLKKKGIKDLPVRLRVGKQDKSSNAGGFGFMHILKHYNQMMSMNPPESPLLHLFNVVTGKLSITNNGALRKTVESYNNGKTRVLVLELKEEGGFYSIVTSYPTSYKARENNGIAIKGVYLKIIPGSKVSGLNESNQVHTTAPESTGVTGQSLEKSVPEKNKRVNIHNLRIFDNSGNLVFRQGREKEVDRASYSLAGHNLAEVGIYVLAAH